MERRRPGGWPSGVPPLRARARLARREPQTVRLRGRAPGWARTFICPQERSTSAEKDPDAILIRRKALPKLVPTLFRVSKPLLKLVSTLFHESKPLPKLSMARFHESKPLPKLSMALFHESKPLLKLPMARFHESKPLLKLVSTQFHGSKPLAKYALTILEIRKTGPGTGVDHLSRGQPWSRQVRTSPPERVVQVQRPNFPSRQASWHILTHNSLSNEIRACSGSLTIVPILLRNPLRIQIIDSIFQGMCAPLPQRPRSNGHCSAVPPAAVSACRVLRPVLLRIRRTNHV